MEAKDLNKITVEVKVNGTPCDFSYLELRQTMFGHHVFTINLNYRAKEQDLWEVTAEQVIEQLGSPVAIQIKDLEDTVVDFDGVITKVDIGGRDSNQGVATIYGGSPTLLMMDDYSMAAFVETDLASVVHETITNIGYPIEHKIEPLNNREIPYVCRYKESSYGFLNRLLSSCGEWFFYDGKKIIVGFSPEQNKKEAIELSYKHDLVKMNISSTVGNYDVEQYDYDPTRDLITQWPSLPESKNMNKFTRKAFTCSKTIHKDYTILPSTIPVCQKTFDLMENSVNATHFNKLSEGSLLKATTLTCKMALGAIVSLESDPLKAKYSKELGKYRLIDVVHRYDNDKCEYENDIVGINADVDYIPARDVVQPMALPEVAMVKDNKDPRNMGRVKVQFVWQQLEDHPQGKTSGWMRVQTPDAGTSEVVDKDRGFFFIPEIGDQVMVGYEYGDPNRPFVMGSLYHSKSTGGIVGENILKAIRTRSGHTLEFNDDEGGEWGITIKDKEGNTIHLDTKGKNIEISAPETLVLMAKNVNIHAEENVQVAAKQNVEVTAESDVSIAAKGNLSQQADGDLEASASGNINVEAQSEISLAGQNVAMEGKAEVSVNGSKTVVSGKMTTIQGASGKIDVM